MKVLLIDQFSELGGAQRGMIDAARAIVERGGEVHAALPQGPAFDILAAFSRRLEPLPCGPFRSERKSARDAARFAAQLPRQVWIVRSMASAVDLIYVHGPRVAPAAALSKAAAPLVYHAHSIVQQRVAAVTLGWALRRHDAIFAISPMVARWLGDLSIRSRVIFNGVAPPKSRPCLSKSGDGLVRIGLLGRIAPEKGQLEFVRAAKIAVRLEARLRFLIAGSPMFAAESYFQRVRAEAGPEVQFLPWSEDVASFFGQIDLLLVPSSPVDAGPRVILEAFAAKIPVLATNWGGNPDLIEHGTNGLLVDSVKPQALAQAMVEAVGDSSRLETLAARGHAIWQERFTTERYCSEVCDALEEVLRSRKRPASAGTSALA